MAVPKFTFNSYELPTVYSVSDPKEGIKNVVIEGFRSDGSVVVPGGKKSQEIVVQGIIVGEDFDEVSAGIDALKAGVTTEPATLAFGSEWSYTVRRLTEIEFEADTRRTSYQKYTIRFLVLSY